MFRSLVLLGAGWFIYTQAGRKTAKNICLNLIPYVEKECGVSIIKPIKELIKEPKEHKNDSCND